MDTSACTLLRELCFLDMWLSSQMSIANLDIISFMTVQTTNSN